MYGWVMTCRGVLPLVDVDVVGLIFVLRLLRAVGVAEHYDAQRDDGIGYPEEVRDEVDTFADGVASTPYGSEPYGMGCEKDVFGCCRAVLHPVVLAFTGEGVGRVAADHDGCLSLGGGAPVALREAVEKIALVDDDEFPGLLVAGGRCGHACAQEGVDCRLGDGCVSVVADA